MIVLRGLLLLLASLTSVAAEAAQVAGVQHGTATSNGNGTVTVALAQPVDPTKSVLFFQTRHASNRPTGSMLRGRLSGPGTLEFIRVTNQNSVIEISWSVVEYTGGVRVQRGTVNQSGTTVDVALAQPVTSVNQAYVLWSKTARANNTSWNSQGPIGGRLLNAGTLRFRAAGADNNHLIHYQVVEFLNAADVLVRSGESGMGGGPLAITVNLASPFDPAATLVLAGYTSSGSGNDVAERMLRTEILGSDSVRFVRESQGDSIDRIVWQVVEFRDGTSVQHGVEGFGPGDAIRTVNLATPVDPARSIALSGMQPAGGQNMGSSDYQADDIIGSGSFTMSVGATTLDMQRGHVASTANVGWFVVSFGAQAVGSVLDVRMDELSWTGAPGQVRDDASGFDGTAFGGVTTAGPDPALAGDPGTCRYGDFDGADDHVLIPHDASLNGTTELVYSAWIQPRSWSGVRQVMAKSVHGGGSGRAQMGIFSENNTLKARVETLAGRRELAVALPPLDAWTHVAAVFRGNQLELYLNGVPAGAVGFGATTLVTTGDDLAIGKRIGTAQYFFDGLIDEVRVYTTALDDAGIAALASATHPCASAPRGEWRFDEFGWNGTPEEVRDYSGNDFHGTAFNTVTGIGRVCNAADFGSPGTADYLVLDETPFDGLTDFTLGVWVRTSQSGRMTLLSGARAAEANELTFAFNGSGRWQPQVLGDVGSNVDVPGLQDGAWHFLVWTREGASNCLYMDDALQGCLNRTQGALAIDPGGLVVAQEQSVVGGGFTANRAFEGELDELLLFDEVLAPAEFAQIRANHLAGLNWDGSNRACAVTGATGFVLSHDNFGIHCADEPITVAAVDAASAIVPSYANQVTLTTGSGRGSFGLLAGSGVLNDPVADDGEATYTFVGADNGTVTVALSYPEGSSPLDVDVYQTSDVTIADDDSEALLVFAPSGFTVTGSALPNPPPSPIADPVAAQIAGVTFPLHITAYGVTEDDPLCGVIESYQGARNLKFHMSYDNPGSGTRAVSVDGQFIGTDPLTAIAQNVSFVAGQAQVAVKYKDVGAISIGLADDASFPNTLAGGSNPFVVKPAELFVSRVESGTGLANPGAAAMNGPGFIPAGEAFEVDVGARDAEGALTPNFGLEVPAESVRVSSTQLVAPVGGRNGSAGDVANGASFSLSATPGVMTNSSVNFDEVGIIRLLPALADGSYLGAGLVAGVETGNVGRFYPDHFALAGNAVGAACGTFTYMDQPALTMSYRLRAETTAGAITENYDESLGVPVASRVHVAEAGDDGVNLAGRLSAINAAWLAGVVDVNQNDVSFARTALPDGPYLPLQIGLSVIDPLDGVPLLGLDMNPATVGDCTAAANCSARALGGTTSVLYGRLAVLPSYGPETRDLPTNLEAQSFGGGAFAHNLQDNCSGYQAADASLGNFTGNLTGADTAIIGPPGAATLTAGAEDPSAPILLRAPGIGHEGTVDLLLDVPVWLEFDWLGAGDEDPEGTLTFGHYRGHDRIIIWREVR